MKYVYVTLALAVCIVTLVPGDPIWLYGGMVLVGIAAVASAQSDLEHFLQHPEAFSAPLGGVLAEAILQWAMKTAGGAFEGLDHGSRVAVTLMPIVSVLVGLYRFQATGETERTS